MCRVATWLPYNDKFYLIDKYIESIITTITNYGTAAAAASHNVKVSSNVEISPSAISTRYIIVTTLNFADRESTRKALRKPLRLGPLLL